MKRRLDQILVDRHLTPSREKAQALILAGKVLVNGQKAWKPGHAYDASEPVELLGQHKYVSRGGLKLERALDYWNIDPRGKVCLDVGASTGGFTDCLLQRAAERVHTVDVGPSQLDWKIQTDQRVVVHDHTNARYLTLETLGERPALAVCDVAFISARLVLPSVAQVLTDDARIVVLVKPQFEVGRDKVGEGGIVRDPELQHGAVSRVRETLQSLGFQTDWIESPILGAEGNREFLLYGWH